MSVKTDQIVKHLLFTVFFILTCVLVYSALPHVWLRNDMTLLVILGVDVLLIGLYWVNATIQTYKLLTSRKTEAEMRATNHYDKKVWSNFRFYISCCSQCMLLALVAWRLLS